MSKTGFERAFAQRLGRDPSRFIEDKLKAGSKLSDVAYEYDIVAAEIQRRSGYLAPPFSTYFRPAMMQSKQEIKQTPQKHVEMDRKPKRPAEQEKKDGQEKQETAKVNVRKNVVQTPAPVIHSTGSPNAKICVREMLYKEEFLERYRRWLWNLAHDRYFMCAIDEIHSKHADIELSADDKNPKFLDFKRRTIPGEFKNRLLCTDPDYQAIEQDFVNRKKHDTSAMISVYYALRLYQIGKNEASQES